MKIVLAALVFVATVGNSLAAAQAQPPQDRINTALARARQVGIPVSLLENKIAEGKAKGVSLERIAAAVERREAALERASQALKGQDRPADADLAVAADAVESGVSDAVLKAVSDSAPRERKAVAIAALTQLVQLGHVPESALARVQAALKRGPEALLNLPAQAGRGGKGPANAPDNSKGRSGGKDGPPESVPAPGGTTQPTKPGGGRPDDPGRPEDPGRPDAPGQSAGRGGGNK